MSSITWKGATLIQTLGPHSVELARVHFEESSNAFVLWLKDTSGVLGLNGGYIRAEEYQSLDDAKEGAAQSPSAFIMHYIWMRGLAKRRTVDALDEHWDEIASAIPDGIGREALRDGVSRYFDQLPIDQIKLWGNRIRDGVIVSALVKLIEKLFGG